jgi:amino acid adenylation domain-containing protein
MQDLADRIASLSPEKLELLSQRLQKENATGSKAEVIPRRSESLELPLSFAQQRMWFIEQLEPGNAAYNVPASVHLKGRVNLFTLEQSLNAVIARHEALRTRFVMVDERPAQIIAPALNLKVTVANLQGLPEVEKQQQSNRLSLEEAQRPFDLARGPLLRVTLLRLSDTDYVLLVVTHHIISDGWSIGVFIREVAALYEAFSTGEPSPLPELPIQYGDFAVWQRQWLQGRILEEQLSYWKQQLSGELPVLELPTNRPRPAVQTLKGARHFFALPTGLSKRLKALSEQEGVTLFMLLLAAFQTLLYRYTGQTDILIGSPIANRNRPETEALIGSFVNTLVLRTSLSGNPRFRELLGRVRDVTLQGYTHQDLPFEKLVEELQPDRDMSRNPLFQIMFVLQNAPMPTLKAPELTMNVIEIDRGTSQFDLTLSLENTEQGIKGLFEYNTDLLDAESIARMQGHFRALLEHIVNNQDCRLDELRLLTDPELHQVAVEWNDREVNFPGDDCLTDLLETQAARTPDAIAVIFNGERITYEAFNRRANQLAHYLQGLGVRPEVCIGICLDRSLEMLVGMLGVLKAGGTYVPLDPGYPHEQLSFMLADSAAPFVLTQEHLLQRLGAHDARLICLDKDWELIAQESEENPESGVTGENLAYVIFTSGSTGRPKGVAIAHRNTSALLRWAHAAFAPEELRGVLASTSICFDLSVFELFVPLTCGGKVILVQNALQLPELPEAEEVTLVNTVPSAIAEIVRKGWIPPKPLTVNLAGEPLAPALVDQLYESGVARRVFDLYGPSEDTTYSTFALREKNGEATIGRPVANTKVYLLDAGLNCVPIGVPGELYIGGSGVVRGYLKRPDLTAERFVPHPFSASPGARAYRTGDLARYFADGNIEFMGRIDHQVKIRGFRIELGEIEAALLQHPAVREVVALAREDQPAQKRLVAYIVPEAQPGPSVSELRNFLIQKLPMHMVPSAFINLDAMPLTPNGKLNRRALPAPGSARPDLEHDFTSPRNDVEELLADMWRDILGLKEIGIHDDFFELGGHSLLATRLQARIFKVLGIELPLRDLFKRPTICGMAEIIAQLQPGEDDDEDLRLLEMVERLSNGQVEAEINRRNPLVKAS